MTNDELAQAIEVVDKKVRECGTLSPRYGPLFEHLKALLAEQRRRASPTPVSTSTPSPSRAGGGGSSRAMNYKDFND